MVLFLLIDLAVAILILAGFALAAVAIRNRMMGRRDDGHLPAFCTGEPNLEDCRTCVFMQRFGDDYSCSKLSGKIRGYNTKPET